MARLPSALSRFRPEIQAELRAAIGAEALAPGLDAMLRYHFGWLDVELRPADVPTGKLLRPSLCLLAAEAVGADYHVALPAAAALELLHNFSLIHDDIQDRGAERHHRPTVWRLWGEAQAIDAGDAALALAELALLRSLERGAPATVVVAAARLLNRACVRLAEGQHLDLGYEGKLDLTVAEYLAMVSGKTAALLGCSLALGALLGSGDAALAAGYARCGEELGLAFQIQDDLLGIWGESEQTGKSTVGDIYQRKMTLPVIAALSRAGAADRAELAAIYRSEAITPALARRAVAIMEAAGADEQARQIVSRHYAAATSLLAALAPAEPAGAALRELAAFVVDRGY